MIQNKQHNQVMITDTKHYINLQDMLLAVLKQHIFGRQHTNQTQAKPM